MKDEEISRIMRKKAQAVARSLAGFPLEEVVTVAVLEPNEKRPDGLRRLTTLLPENIRAAEDHLRKCVKEHKVFCYTAMFREGDRAFLRFESLTEGFQWNFHVREIQGKPSISMPEQRPLDVSERVLRAG